MAGLTRDDENVRKICRSVSDELWDVQSERVPMWRDIAEELYPVAVSGLDSRVSGQRKKYDEKLRATNAGLTALKKGAAGFSIHLTSPARPWFELGSALHLNDVNERSQVDSGLETLTDAVRQVFEVSGLYNQLDKLYEHLLAFGTACMLVFPYDGLGYKLVEATTLRPGTFALGIGADGLVNRCSRKFEFTLQQIVEEFGLAVLPDDLKDAFNKGQGLKWRYTITNLIEPNRAGNLFDEVAKLCKFNSRANAAFAYRSIYWADFGVGAMQDRCRLLAVRPLVYNPIIAPRMEFEAGDVWGRGYGVDALPVARLLGLLREDSINITGNIAEPSLFVDQSLQGQQLHFERGGMNFWNGREGVNPSIPAVPTPQTLNGIDQLFQACQAELNEIFFVNRFATIDALKSNPGVKTATEINQLVRENMGLLGSVVTGLDKELLDPLVELVVAYTLDVAQDIGYNIESLSPVLEGGAGFKVRYVGEIHQAMKAGNLSAMERVVQFAGGVAQAIGSLEPMDNFDADSCVRDYADSVGARTSMFKAPEEVDAIRAQRAEQMAQMAQMQAMQAGAATMKDGAGAMKQMADAGISPEQLFGGGAQ